ncbi:MAG: hypothetical protein J6Y77_02350 [Paludibacteraceae bacterium]|nr:hypothetical protein [Paludibacteraceae bacterium]
MKHFWLLLSLPLVLSACRPEEPQNAGEVGAIELNRVRIGLGQPVEAIAQETGAPTGLLSQRTMRWLLNDKQQVSDDNTFADGYFVRTIYPDRLGENRLELLVSYVFQRSTGQVTQTKMTSSEITFDVEPCDVRTSFWGDSPEWCRYNEVQTRLEGNEQLLQSTFVPEYSRPHSLCYYFENDSLCRVEQREIIVISSLADPSQFFNAYIKGKDKIDVQYNGGLLAGVRAVYNGASSEVTAAWERVYAQYLAGDRSVIAYLDQRTLGAALFDGSLRLESDYEVSARTRMTYRAEASVLEAYTDAIFLTQDFVPQTPDGE